MRKPKLPAAMLEVIRLADEMPDAAVEAAGVEVKRQWFAPSTMTEMSAWVQSDARYGDWYKSLQEFLGVWVSDRFGAEALAVKTADKDPRSPLLYVRPALQGAALAMTAYGMGSLSVDAYRDACRPWLAAQEAAIE